MGEGGEVEGEEEARRGKDRNRRDGFSANRSIEYCNKGSGTARKMVFVENGNLCTRRRESCRACSVPLGKEGKSTAESLFARESAGKGESSRPEVDLLSSLLLSSLRLPSLHPLSVVPVSWTTNLPCSSYLSFRPDLSQGSNKRVHFLQDANARESTHSFRSSFCSSQHCFPIRSTTTTTTTSSSFPSQCPCLGCRRRLGRYRFLPRLVRSWLSS